ncbi:hypothetical protein R3P38DRAFT_3226192 [Favolaschia claudopus]|uniref:Uncharacterized protein n=1 Tax=Favolaschia claudopus TaxID=2862362 RepID=A0AAV9ZUX6_9AGAR
MFFHFLALNELIQDFDNPETICFSCGHPYLVHTIQFSDLTEQNKMFAPGGTSDGRCASFWSASVTWTMRLICICGARWSALVQPPATLTTTATTTTSAVFSGTPSHSLPQPVPAAASSTASSVIVPHRPVVAFTGLARPLTASVQQARQASIQRNLHGLGAGSSALTPTSPPEKKRKSGPPPPLVHRHPGFWCSIERLRDNQCTDLSHYLLDTSDFNDPLDLSPRLFLGLPAASPITFCRTAALGSVSSTLSFLLLVAIPIPCAEKRAQL